MYPDTLHTSETFHEDKVVLLSAEHVMFAFGHPKDYFNMALYEYCSIFLQTMTKAPYPEFHTNEMWKALEYISGFSKEFMQSCIGIDAIDIRACILVHWLTYPEKFRLSLPELYEHLCGIMAMRP
jgi:hypothetical protein